MKQLVFLLSLLNIIFFSQMIGQKEPVSSIRMSIEQERAFEVLNLKCNACHRIQNPSKVFSIQNMNGYSKKINRQVFIWKRMPKGEDFNLSEKEVETLKAWLNFLKIN